MRLYKCDKDDKWHQDDCKYFNKDKIIKHIRIGSMGEPDPLYEEIKKI